MRDFILLIGRILMVPTYWAPAYLNIVGYAEMKANMAQMRVPIPGILLMAGITFMIIGMLFVLLGLWTRLGIVLLIVFLIPATLIFHANWADQGELIQFGKNFGLIAGLLFLWVSGPGRIALRK